MISKENRFVTPKAEPSFALQRLTNEYYPVNRLIQKS